MADPDEVMRRIRSREQARVRTSGTISTTNWRYNPTQQQRAKTRFNRWVSDRNHGEEK